MRAAALTAEDCDFDPMPARWSAWAAGFGGGGINNGNPSVTSTSISANVFGFAAGVDFNYSSNTLFGAAVSTGGSNWWLSGGSGSGQATTVQAGVYALTREGPAYFSLAASVGNHSTTINRAPLGDSLTARYDSQTYAARGEAGYRFALRGDDFGLTPYGAAQVQLLHTPGYTETDISGSGFGLSYTAANTVYTRTELGARFDGRVNVGGLPLALLGRLGWAHDFVGTPGVTAAFAALPGSTFTVAGLAPPPDSALASLGAEYAIASSVTLGAKVEGEFSGQAQSYVGRVSARFRW